MVELADIKPGSRVLDIATGLGEPALTAARAAGPKGKVVATDLSEEMMAFAATRAEELGLGADRIVISAKVSAVQDLISVYRALAERCDYPLHLGVTEAGLPPDGVCGQVS